MVFSSPFDDSAVDLLETLDAPTYKTASFEAIDLALIWKVASTGKPIIISTGMTSLEEIEQAVSVSKESGSGEIALLHCISGYPTPPQESNLRTICVLANRFDAEIGLSDHTLGAVVSVAAVALGATIMSRCNAATEDLMPHFHSSQPSLLSSLPVPLKCDRRSAPSIIRGHPVSRATRCFAVLFTWSRTCSRVNNFPATTSVRYGLASV